MFLISESGCRQIRLDAIDSFSIYCSCGPDTNKWRLTALLRSRESNSIASFDTEDEAKEWMAIVSRAVQDRTQRGALAAWIDLSRQKSREFLWRTYGDGALRDDRGAANNDSQNQGDK